MTKAFPYHQDPGHGWIEVSIAELQMVGLRPNGFSSCSYRKGDRFFLEEDCDAGVFVEAYKRVFGEAPAFKEVHTDHQHWIRNLPNIHESAA